MSFANKQLSELLPSFTAHGQGHVFAHAETLDEATQQQLARDLATCDPQTVKDIFDEAIASDSRVSRAAKGRPQPLEDVVSAGTMPEDMKVLYQSETFRQIRMGKVAVVLLAGGQNDGSSEPIGACDLGLPSKKTLFQMHAERLIRVQELTRKKTGGGQPPPLPWYIMCSELNAKATQQYFVHNNYFGMGKENVMFFVQGSLPVLTSDGKFVLKTAASLAKSPDGNGGIYPALMSSGVLENMKKRGIEHVHVHAVDNILGKVADPLFLGFCIQRGAEVGCKVVSKRAPDEPMGVVCEVNGHCEVLEYSDIDHALAKSRDSTGNLVYSAGNICDHYFTVEFLEEVCAALSDKKIPYHVTRRKVRALSKDSSRGTGLTNTIQLRLFVSDAFSRARSVSVLEVARSKEFSAVKTLSGTNENSAASGCRDLYKLHQGWITAVGGRVEDPEGVDSPCEISPLVSYEGEDLGERCGGMTYTLPCRIDPVVDQGRPSAVSNAGLGTPGAPQFPDGRSEGTSCMGRGCTVQ